MDFFQANNPLSSTASLSQEDQALINAFYAGLKEVGQGVCDILDNWISLNPHAPRINSIMVQITQTQLHISLPNHLGQDLPDQVSTACAAQIEKLPLATNGIRETLPECALPFRMELFVEVYHGPKGVHNKIEQLHAWAAGLPMMHGHNANFSFWLLPKLALIENTAQPGECRDWDILKTPSSGSERLLVLPEATHLHTIQARSSQEAQLKAAALSLSLKAMKRLITENIIDDRSADRLAYLHVAPRQPSVLSSLNP